MRIALISAASRADPLRKQEPMMPLSLPALAACAPNHEYSLYDLLWDDDIDWRKPVDLAGVSVRLHGEERAYAVAQRFRAGGVPVILGGPQVSARPHEAIAHADAVAIGEGELLWPRIIADAVCKRLASFYVCSHQRFDPKGKAVVRIKPDPHLRFPAAARELFKRRYTFDTVFASRGCPVGCDFCSVSRLFGDRVRTRPIEDVVAEISSFKKYYYLLDDTVFGRPEVYDYYLELYSRIAALDRRRYWIGQANLDAVDNPRGREVIRRAARAGLLYAAIGIESIHPETLALSGAAAKIGGRDSIDPAAIRKRIRFIQEQGIFVSGWFVVGYETDSADTFDACLSFCEECDIFPVIFPVRALPGTRLYERATAAGLLSTDDSFTIRHPDLSEKAVIESIARISRQGYRWRSIAGRLARHWSRLSGDRIHKTMFGLMTQRKLRRAADILHDNFFRSR